MARAMRDVPLKTFVQFYTTESASPPRLETICEDQPECIIGAAASKNGDDVLLFLKW